MNKILILEDDRKLNDGIRLALRREDCTFLQCQTIEEARELLKKEKVRLILLDLNLPDGNGLDFLQEIRAKSAVPVIIITANNMETDIVMGLEMGANDYITKPFSLPEVAARISAHLRREARSHDSSRLMTSRGLLVNLSRRTVYYKGDEIALSKREFDILELLLTHAGQVFDRERIYETVWGLDASGDSGVVKEHIRKIRQKLQTSTGQDYIETVWGVGYRWKQ